MTSRLVPFAENKLLSYGTCLSVFEDHTAVFKRPYQGQENLESNLNISMYNLFHSTCIVFTFKKCMYLQINSGKERV